MIDRILLNGTWDLHLTEEVPEYYWPETLEGHPAIAAQVPAPIHAVLVDAGLLDDPYVGTNTLKARWVEEQFCVYRRRFDMPSQPDGARAWLTFARLEYDAVIVLNGEVIGRHSNAHRDLRTEVTGKLKPEGNLLVVQLESGQHALNDKPVAGYGADWLARMSRRPLMRKPQYQCGWDWNPHLVNIGILGDVALEVGEGPRLDSVMVTATPTPDLASAVIAVRAWVDQPRSAAVRVVVTDPDGAIVGDIRQAVLEDLSIGETRMEVHVSSARLWWPAEHGDQPLYSVDVTLETAGGECSVRRRVGIRSVEIDQSPHPEAGTHCILKVNGRPIFSKGGNWVPPDMLYSLTDAERTRELVRLARGANFNTLRIWGGGLYADQALCDACDEAGVLMWHDLLFACAQYPGDDPEFLDEVEREVTAAVRNMAHHPSLVVWCGNNEIEWGDAAWGYRHMRPVSPHYVMFHRVLPSLVEREDPTKVYWISSPWSPGYAPPNDPTTGDQHPWGVSLMEPGGADFWLYRQYVDRFPNEGGVLGASSPATLRQFLPPAEQRLQSASWVHHDNPFAQRGSSPGSLGHAYDTVRLWTGSDPLKLEWETYAFASALLQAEGLQEYILNYRRRMFSSASAIFWMYNDSWPATHGWTIVDYYLRRKLAYHPVRRAFAPVTVVVADEGDALGIYGINETRCDWSGRLRRGVFRLAGGFDDDATVDAVLPANTSVRLASLPSALLDGDSARYAGAFALLLGDDEVKAQHRIFRARFGDLQFAPARVTVRMEDDRAVLESDTFVWGVCLDVDGEASLSDNCFDLIPGVGYTVPWSSTLGGAHVVSIGSRDVPFGAA